MEFSHKPVLLKEALDGLKCGTGGTYVDGTVGLGGHSQEIAKRILPEGLLVCIDRDKQALIAAEKRLAVHNNNIIYVHDNFKNIKIILKRLNISYINGMLLDLGVSSYQFDEADRGFTYRYDAPLDMRMDVSQDITASYIVNNLSCKELTRIIQKYGEEKWAGRIANIIVRERKEEEIKTTGRLVDIIKDAIPAAARRKGGHPAKRTFQALRIEVNQEIQVLEQSIKDIVDLLDKGGRLCIISFHSLEDRIVKHTFKELVRTCSCPHDFPICVCGRKAKIRVINAKPIVPCDDEINVNPRSKSAKLRICERV